MLNILPVSSLFDLKLNNCNHGNVDLECLIFILDFNLPYFGVQATYNRQKGLLECLSISLMTLWCTIRKNRSSFIEIVRKNETCTSFFYCRKWGGCSKTQPNCRVGCFLRLTLKHIQKRKKCLKKCLICKMFGYPDSRL